MHKKILIILFLLYSGFYISKTKAAESETFTVVIDPGHGGMDPGTLGSIVKEKDVVLPVGVRLGEMIKQRHPDVRVIYTRSTDVFIPLNQRAIIANKAKANLFISIHADHAESSSVRGASTFTLGQNRTRENFEIAKRENSVILLEEDYKQRYEGFDPNSAESYIMFEFMQDNYMNQSVQFASMLQSKFSSVGRYDRGVRQDVFLVLRCTSMPSVLVELGFLSNREEERYLKSEDGRDQMANCILKGFTDFKNDYERKSTGKQTTTTTTTTRTTSRSRRNSNSQARYLDSVAESQNKYQKEDGSKEERSDSEESKSTDTDTGIRFRIQMLTSTFKLSKSNNQFKNLSMDYFIERNIYKYTYGNFSSFDDANQKRREFRKTFTDAFVIAFKNGQKISVDEARAQSQH
jgi:N-acetylmuramoyl-L-alanine amidase